MWQKSGSSKSLDNRSTEEYIKRLNTQKLAGYSDWRIPTIDELASLLSRRRKSGVHIDPVFNNKLVRCWSADQADITSPYYSGAWIVSFKLGEVTLAMWLSERSATYGAGSSNKNIMNYLKAVRSLELASIPKTAAVARISLRKKPLKISSEKKINSMLAKYGFFDISRNPLGSFDNRFVDNNDGTVTDRATGLMWQKSGSSKSLENRGTKKYVQQLNRQRFAGQSNWRMPTIEELASLLKKAKINGVHIDSIFNNKQIRCWTIDQCDTNRSYQLGAWLVHFQFGEISKAMWIDPKTGSGIGYLESTNITNYVKAVRSIR
jgi:DNA-binding IclR family transcriptional regulator